MRENLMALGSTGAFMAGSVAAFAALTGFAVLIAAPASITMLCAGYWMACKVEA